MPEPVSHSKVSVVLGPTNTGKTYYAMARMLGHKSGMIGFPLRLLARENYDRAVAVKGAAQVALITGEEKILPEGARYILCTVEAMPMDQRVDFLAVDEIQMCTDPDRGHVFTDRLLKARGDHETMFLGAETMKPMIKRLVSEAEYISRPRMSILRYAGSRKINRLNPRSAVVAFTINDVYAIAELLRRQRGGAGVVSGALSPRTRNAQVAMYQAGEVDYLVATDAIGMGLNMDVHHVAFASTRKFDGKRFRQLTAEELAQTAGRAGRHTDDGTFGVTGNVPPLDMETIERIENHRFDDHRQIYWRNSDLALNTLEALKASLRERAEKDGIIRVREATDERALMELSRDPEIADSALNPDGTVLLWDVCQIPDFEKEWTIGHARLLDRVYRHLRFGDGRLPADWMAEHVNRIECLEGDIDALSNRIARIRTWTYISHKADWIADPLHWQGRTREIEDRLSDVLHERLMQRFVDKRTAMLVSKMNAREDLVATIRSDGRVLVEGQFIGQLVGLGFIPDEAQFSADRKVLNGAAVRVLRQEITRRIAALCDQENPAFEWAENNTILWMGETIGKVRRGNNLLRPLISIPHNDYVDGPGREKLARAIETWLTETVQTALQPLFDLTGVEMASGPVRGLVFQIIESLGSTSRQNALKQIGALSREDRKLLRGLGIFIGRSTIFMPRLLKPAAISMRARLWHLWHEPAQRFEPPKPGLITIELSERARFDDEESRFMAAMGYPVFRDSVGMFAVRMDMLERIAGKAWSLGVKGPFTMDDSLMSFAGAGGERTTAILKGLGFQVVENDGIVQFRVPGKSRGKQGPPPDQRKKSGKNGQKKTKSNRKRQKPSGDPSSPFAVLKDLKV